MGHAIQYRDYHCSTSEKAILKEINSFAYDPQESSGYHGNLKFHKEPVYKNREDAANAILVSKYKPSGIMPTSAATVPSILCRKDRCRL